MIVIALIYGLFAAMSGSTTVRMMGSIGITLFILAAAPVAPDLEGLITEPKPLTHDCRKVVHDLPASRETSHGLNDDLNWV